MTAESRLPAVLLTHMHTPMHKHKFKHALFWTFMNTFQACTVPGAYEHKFQYELFHVYINTNSNTYVHFQSNTKHSKTCM